MIRLKNLTIKNFMSIGNASQGVILDRNDLTLVLGENLDLGGNGSKNGVGKTSLLNAMSYALYGNALTNIKQNNLINKTNGKHMMVSVEFDVNDKSYRIERGRKPNILKFYCDDEELDDNDARGEMRDTQKEITSILGMSHEMFKHTVALNTYTTPFLSLRANDQKHLIEELLGITVLSDKADNLKIAHKINKGEVREEEHRIDAITKVNDNLKNQIKTIKRRQTLWINSKNSNITNLSESIEKLLDLNIDGEIQSHRDLVKYKKNKKEIDECNKWIRQIERDDKTNERNIAVYEKDLELIEEHKCHACGQDMHDDKQAENKKAKLKLRESAVLQLLANETQMFEHKDKLTAIGDIGEDPEPFYDTVEEAHKHQNTLDTLTAQLESALLDNDPYKEQIEEMEIEADTEIDYTELNRLVEIQEHQAFLLKLLTSKDSFIRRKIIEQNLSYLNNRLTHYLDEIDLPHQVQFLSDLSVEITDLGRDLDEGNLSRGERTRLILALSWAFRDVWESLYSHINVMFVDELLDNGLDTNGVESAVKILKELARSRRKSVWLISHREELTSRVQNTLIVQKENGFTAFNTDNN